MSKHHNPISRRRALATLGAGAAGAAIAATAASLAHGTVADPIYRAIDNHRNAFRAYLAKFDPLAEAETQAFALPLGSPEREAADTIAEARFLDQVGASETAETIAYDMADTRPTTLAGCAALLRYAIEHNDAGHLFPDQLEGGTPEEREYGLANGGHRDMWQHRLSVSLAEALATIAAKGGAA